MKLFILFVILFTMAACSATEKLGSDNRFYNDAEKYLGKYGYEISGNKTTIGFVMFELHVDKNKLNYKELSKLKEQLVKDGWEYNYDLDGYYWSFCKNKTNDAIGVYYPNQSINVMKNGQGFREDLNPDKVYIWITRYKNNDDNLRFTECMGDN
ncbi:hypothetical protein [Acinetobacter rudis]|uniref:hypothetical protein n=1 Tax=Acinetobacter rudis TaxID=632955 RepID=UPI003342C175